VIKRDYLISIHFILFNFILVHTFKFFISFYFIGILGGTFAGLVFCYLMCLVFCVAPGCVQKHSHRDLIEEVEVDMETVGDMEMEMVGEETVAEVETEDEVVGEMEITMQ
jgi:hypothetical protein